MMVAKCSEALVQIRQLRWRAEALVDVRGYDASVYLGTVLRSPLWLANVRVRVPINNLVLERDTPCGDPSSGFAIR